MKFRFSLWALAALTTLAACAPAATPAPPTATATPLPSATATMAPPTATVAASATTAPSATFTAEPSATATTVLTPTATLTSTATAGAATNTPKPTVAGGGDFSPTVASVWNTTIGPDNATGTCAGTVTPVYGLVQITPAGDTLTWRNQEPTPYTFSKTGASTFMYSGPSSVGDGTVTMVVVFTSATTFQMTRTFVASTDPNCTHVHQYNGTFQWNS